MISISLFIAAWTAAAAPQSAPAVRNVAVVSLLPRHTDQKLLELIKTKLGEGRRFEVYTTMGDPEQTASIRKTLAAKPPEVLLVLDAVCLKPVAEGFSGPCLVLARSAGMLEENETSSTTAKYCPCVIQTLPPAGSLVEGLKTLTPPPPRIGLVYNVADESNESFAKELTGLMPASAKGEPKLLTCPIAPGGCRNANEVREDLQQSLKNLKAGDVLVALPGPNTLKFAYIIAQFATGCHLALMGIGQWQTMTMVASVEITPEALADACVQNLRALGPNVMPSHTGITVINPPSLFHVNEEQMKALGFSTQKEIR